MAGTSFSVNGASLSTATLTTRAATDVLGQLFADSDNYLFTIDLSDGHVLDGNLLEFKKSLLEDKEVMEAFQKGREPEIVIRAFEAIPKVTVRRSNKMSTEAWARIKQKSLDSNASLNADDSVTYSASAAVVVAFETVSIKYISSELGAGAPPDKVDLLEVVRKPNDSFESPASSSNHRPFVSFVASHCGVYGAKNLFSLPGSYDSTRLVEYCLLKAGGRPLLPVRENATITSREFNNWLDDLISAARSAQPDLIILYHIGHTVSLGMGNLNLVLSDAPPDLPLAHDYALIRHSMDAPQNPAHGSNLAELTDIMQTLEHETSQDEPGLVALSALHRRLSELGIPFAIIVDGCFMRDDMKRLRKELGFDDTGSNYFGPNLTSVEEQRAYQRVMDSFGGAPYLRSTNIVVLGAKPGSAALMVENPFSSWDITPKIGPLAVRLAGRLQETRDSDHLITWGEALSGLADWRGTGEIDFRGTVCWSDFSRLDGIKISNSH
jgi:hypothetical protein